MELGNRGTSSVAFPAKLAREHGKSALSARHSRSDEPWSRLRRTTLRIRKSRLAAEIGTIVHEHAHQLTLGLAFGLGALHALEPGHGKTAMLVYLAGERRSFLHPLVMGLSSALAHSVSLIAIAAAVHLTHHLVTGDHHHGDEAVTSAMRWVSAGLVLCVGLWMLFAARRAKPSGCSCCGKDHSSGDHTHDGESKKWFGSKTSYSMSALLGVAFGLLPCPSAMAAYFTSMSAGTPVAAYGVIGLFAAGIACSITLFGMLVQVFGTRMMSSQSALTKLPWPYIRAGLILSIGAFYTVRLAV